MKKTKSIRMVSGAAAALTVHASSMAAVSAQAPTPIPVPDVVGGGPGDLQGFITTVIQAALNLLGLIAVVVIILAGIRLVVGGQEEGQREKARNAILYAIIGLVVVVLAKVLVDFVVSALFS